MAGRIAGITVEIGGDVTGLESALKSVNSTIKTTQSQLKDVERLLKLDPSNTELLAQKQEKLKEAISATKQKLDTLKTAQQQAKAQMESGDLGKDKYEALQREIIETEQELKRLCQEAANANTTLNKIESAGKTLQNVGDKTASVGKSLTKNVTTPILAIGAAAVKTTADFDEEMSKVSAISGATGKDFDSLRTKAREMGAKTKFSATEAGEAFEYMAMAGWKTGDMLDGIEGIMNLAAASGEDLATTSDIVTDALTAFGLQAKDSGHFADVLAAASSNANTNVGMMGESFKMAAPVCGSLGISAEDASVALGLMANAGIKGSQAGSSLRTGLVNLSKPTKQMTTYMKKYGVELKTNADGSVNLRDTMTNLRERMKGLSETQQAAALSAIFGKNSMAAWAAIVNASEEDFEKLTAAIDGCDGSAEQMAATMQDNLNGQITILKSALQELAIQIGDALMPTIRNIVSAIQGWVEKLQQMDEGTRNTILKIAAFAAAIGPVLVVVGKLTSTVGKSMQAIASMGKSILGLVYQTQNGVGPIAKLGSAIGGLSAPVLAIVAVIAVLVAAFIHLWNTNEEFRNKVTAIWESVKAAFQGLADKISEILGGVELNFSTVTEAIRAVWDGLCQVLAPVIEGALNAVATVFTTVLNVITSLLTAFQGLFSGNWQMLWDGVSGIFTSIWDGISSFFSNILNTLKGVADAFLSLFGTSWEEAWNGISEFFTNIWTGISTFFSNTWTGIQNTAATVWNAVSITASDVWTGISTKVTEIVTGLTTGISEAWRTIKSTTTSVFNSVKTSVTNVWNGIKNAITNVVDAIKDTISTGFNAAKTTASNIFNSIKTSISNAVNNARNAVSNAISAIRSVFNFSWSLPKLKLPHFSVSGRFSLNPISVPHLSISWYKKAMDKGIIMDKPTVFGAEGNTLLAGGEAGSETVVGTNSLMDMIKDAVASMVSNTTINYGGVNINVYQKENQDMRALADEIEYRINHNVMRRRAAVGT